MTQDVLVGFRTAPMGGFFAQAPMAANHRFQVLEDSRIVEMGGMLSGNTSGACGCAGCHAIADAAIGGTVTPAKCTVNSQGEIVAIVQYLGVEADSDEKRVADLAFFGFSRAMWTRTQIQGMQTCRAAAAWSGGSMNCAGGRLGLRDCAHVCIFSADSMVTHNLPVVNESNCIACGDRIEKCLKTPFFFHPASKRISVSRVDALKRKPVKDKSKIDPIANGRFGSYSQRTFATFRPESYAN